MFGKSLRCLLTPALCLSVARDQFVFEEEGSPVLRRFNVSSSSQLDKAVSKALNYGLDVWQATPDHIDVYFPSNATRSPIKLPFEDFPVLNSESSQAVNATAWNTSFPTSTFHSSYHPLPEIEEFILALANDHPDLVELVDIGSTGEQRKMTALKISNTPKPVLDQENGASARQKGAVVIMGAQHAREWIAVSTALYLAHGLVADPTEHYSLSGLLRRYDFYIIPVANPDGYQYTWTSDRFWYKTRQHLSPNDKCIGIDMNRNWGYKWKPTHKPGEGACGYWYAGSRPFQASETNNIANFVWTLPHLKVFLDLRSYGQMISSPYSFSCKRVPKDAEDQLEAASGAVAAVSRVHAVPYTMGRLCSQLYPAPGNAVDWMYQRRAIKYSYAVHLRDTGTYGFSLPPEWIRPVGEETSRLVEYLATFIITKPA